LIIELEIEGKIMSVEALIGSEKQLSRGAIAVTIWIFWSIGRSALPTPVNQIRG